MARYSGAESVTLMSERMFRLLNYSVTFINTSDPYTDTPSPDLEGTLPVNEISTDLQQHHYDWESESRPKTSQMDCYRLEALSAAALYSTRKINDVPQTASVGRLDLQSISQPQTPVRDTRCSPFSPPSSMVSPSNNLNFLLNPTSLSSPITDSNLQRPPSAKGSSLSSVSNSPFGNLRGTPSELAVETKHEIAFLLRYFSETLGPWCVFR